MLTVDNKRVTFISDRCTRCGTCVADCPVKAISVKKTAKSFDIVIDQGACILCGKCVKVCPAGQIPDLPASTADIEQAKIICLAASKNADVRRYASSGGIARTIARAALEKKLVDAVYSLVECQEPPYYEGRYITDPSEIDKLPRSVYCPLPVNANLQKKIDGKTPESILFIGTNCHIQGARLFYRKTKTRLVTIAIVCKQQKNNDYLAWSKRKIGLRKKTSANVFFRGDGWPGDIRSDESDIRFKDYGGIPFGLHIWTVKGCKYCPNLFGQDSDFLLADPWGLVPWNDPDDNGQNIVMVRSEKAAEIWNTIKDEYIDVTRRDVSPSDVKSSIQWDLYQKLKIDRVNYYLGKEQSLRKRLKFAALDLFRNMVGTIIHYFPVPLKIEKILNRYMPR